MNSNYGSNSNDIECEECISKAEFKNLQLRMGILIQCKGSKYYSTFLFRSHPFLLTHSLKSLLYSVVQAKDPEKFISTFFLNETKAFKEIFLFACFHASDSASARVSFAPIISSCKC